MWRFCFVGSKVYLGSPFLVLVGLMTTTSSFNIQIVTYGNPSVYSLGAIPLIAPAIKKALNEIRTLYAGSFDVQHTFLFDKDAVTCKDVMAQAEYLIAELYYNVTKENTTDMLALVSPGCGEEMQVVKLSYEWNIATVFGTLATSSFRDREQYPQVIAGAFANHFPYAQFFTSIIKLYNWKDLFFVYDSFGVEVFRRGVLALEIFLKTTISGLQIDPMGLDCSSGFSFESVLTKFQAESRILAFLGHANCTRLLMIHAAQANLTGGNYVYFAAEFLKGTSQYGTLTWRNDDKDDEAAREAFRSLLVLAPIDVDKASEYPGAAFEEEMIKGSLEMYNYTYPLGEKPSIVVKTMYECFLMVAQVLNETLPGEQIDEKLQRPIDGASFIRNFLNRTFTFPTGSVFIDSAGERAEELVLLNFNPRSGRMRPVLRQDKLTYKLVKMNTMQWPANWPVPNKPECGFSGKDGSCLTKTSISTLVAIFCGAAGSLLFIICCGLIRFEARFRDRSWNIDIQQLKFMEKNVSVYYHKSRSTQGYQVYCQKKTLLSEGKGTASYKLKEIWLNKLGIKTSLREGRATNSLLGKMRAISHANVCIFIGILKKDDHIFIAYEFCPRGCLRKYMMKANVAFDNLLKQSLISDVSEGLLYIHKSSIKYHGTLRDSNCLIDRHLTAKVAEAGHNRLLDTVLNIKQNINSLPISELIWIAPEIRNTTNSGTQTADIYSLGLLSYRIISELEIGLFNLAISNPSALPGLENWNHDDSLNELLLRCWSISPTDRPTSAEFNKEYFKITGSASSSFIEKVLRRVNCYAKDLEIAVKERTQQLLVERKRCDALLLEMLPRNTVDSLRLGQIVEPEVFDSVTISFSDIVGFAEFVSTAPALVVVTFLNGSYTVFDRAINGFDVYKVETISDSYMVASGLPVRNGSKHAGEICRMSMLIKKTFAEMFVSQFMKVRTGINSGACAAAIVGLKRPRYCLFGDTVNTASRMQTSGEKNKIHLSFATTAIIRDLPTMKVICRGDTTIKGKGNMETFWLESCP